MGLLLTNGSGYRVQRHPVTGIPLAIVWFVEAAIIIGITLRAMRSASWRNCPLRTTRVLGYDESATLINPTRSLPEHLAAFESRRSRLWGGEPARAGVRPVRLAHPGNIPPSATTNWACIATSPSPRTRKATRSEKKESLPDQSARAENTSDLPPEIEPARRVAQLSAADASAAILCHANFVCV